MSSYPLVKFVDSPAAAAVVRYDFNDQAATPVKKVTKFDPGVPTLEGDPDAVGQQWGFRGPSIEHVITGTKAQAMAQLTLLSREQLRRTNWLLFQPSAGTQPVWFKTYRTGYQPITLDQVWVRVTGGNDVLLKDTWKITVPVVADAFTYGARVTIPTVQVIQAPADLAGPVRTAMHVVLPAIKGEAPTPLRVTVTPSTAGATNVASVLSTWLLGCIAGTAAMADTVIDIGTGDAFTAGTGTAAGSADATYFGGSYRQVTIGALTPNLLNRLSGPLPVMPAGRYKVLLRSAYTAGVSKTLLFMLGQTSGSGQPFSLPSVSVPVTPTDTARKLWVDLGDITLPFGLTNPPSDSGGTPGPGKITVFIGTSDGTASAVRLDAIKLIPIDGPTVTRATLLFAHDPTIFAQGGFASAAVTGTIDGDLEQYWSRTPGTNVFVENLMSMRGSYPVADPAAAQNLLLVMAIDPGTFALAGTNWISDLNAQSAIDVFYYPKYLHVGDGT